MGRCGSRLYRSTRGVDELKLLWSCQLEHALVSAANSQNEEVERQIEAVEARNEDLRQQIQQCQERR
jgi:hypothetical protein